MPVVVPLCIVLLTIWYNLSSPQYLMLDRGNWHHAFIFTTRAIASISGDVFGHSRFIFVSGLGIIRDHFVPSLRDIDTELIHTDHYCDFGPLPNKSRVSVLE